MSSYFAHRRDCRSKQAERRTRIESLPPAYHEPLSSADKVILTKPIAEVVSGVQSGALSPNDVLLAYGKKALRAHAATNCLTEIMISDAELWARGCRKQGPLAGVPVSLKDEHAVAGYDACIGYSAWVGKHAPRDSALVRLLRDAGAVLYVKTNVPITMCSFECTNDLFGRTTNPHNANYAPGGSSGGEAALLAYGGSRVGVGSDGAGSVRVPSHYSGTYTIKASSSRFLKSGNGPTSTPGLEGVSVAFSPMARTLADLETFWRAVMSMKPWEYDPYVVPMPWRDVELPPTKPVRWGVIWDDGVVAPSPACLRALQDVVSALESNGHEVVAIEPPSLFEGLELGSQLFYPDSGKLCVAPMRTGEYQDPGVEQALAMFRAPRFIKRLYAWYIRRVRRDPQYAALIEEWFDKTVPQYLGLVARREAYRARWHEFWQNEGLDFVVTVPNAHPAVPNGGMLEGWKSCTYTVLFNLLDYSAGVLPVTHVDKERDVLLSAFKPRNAIEAGAYRMYDAQKMHGLPVGVQIVGRRFQEEKVLEGMKTVERLLRREGKAYEVLERDV
ncbi:hypothetical protein POSPLADRAFT_1055337 [Postia placenta MAD-698-R-SB12]|uniref:amidase n=1 Tax=Postia placenta MAD-698-R-SB12 TaxID=670580 RepID=A0A1X6N3R7_9APHY|nr:hypothetical protein POSPLADRAFT_1055337 [Postia placenta MAD-698-R-SB12]OSX63279.1 hypothetical protein POSPLADRAFT_1055337 [Postia placenta MAD-698-R-SB12]